LPHTRLETEVEKDGDRWLLRLTNTDSPAAFCVWVEDARPVDAAGGAFFDDNYLTLLPGETRQVAVTWHGVPEPARQLTIAGWNTDEITLPQA
ncbi:MAG TPA: glycoside hydrolase family 2 protein, partial [Anaerolineae bacterium]|nr:glycoside hydrolase family 2 protein [Anaerolineae bacterium]